MLSSCTWRSAANGEGESAQLGWNQNCGTAVVTTESKRYARRVHFLAAGVVVTGSAGNALLRVGLSSGSPLVTFSPMAYLKEFANIAVVLGVAILMLGFILQLSLLSWADLTYAIPVTSSSYVVIAVVGVFGLHEHISPAHWVGILLILLGVVIVGRTKPLTTGTQRR